MHRKIVWRVLPSISVYSEADIEWLRACGLKAYIKPSTKLSIGSGHEIMTSSCEVYVTTETAEQETWVKLYWEDRVYEFSIEQ